MNARLPTILDDLFPDTLPEFSAITEAWPAHVISQILALVWDGFDRLKALPNFTQLDFTQDYAQLERSLTDLHMLEVTRLWGERFGAFASFIPQHEAWELQAVRGRSARPPSCDLGFVHLSNRRLRWAVEAKVLTSPNAMADYLADLQKYLDGRSAPFAAESALVAYLISGTSDQVFAAIANKTSCELKQPDGFLHRPHRYSEHERIADTAAKGVPMRFICHHLVFSLN
jgi:hypothetical protein